MQKGRRLRKIARLDIKSEKLLKPIRAEGLRNLGLAKDFSKRYYEKGIDEIIVVDIVASLYRRDPIWSVLQSISNHCHIPITYCGGVRSMKHVEEAIMNGADKVAVNTYAIESPAIIEAISRVYGSQCAIVMIDAKKVKSGWECYVDGGREKTGIQVLDWAKKAQDLGAGGIFLNSVDQDGVRNGLDIELVDAVTAIVSIPVVVSGGIGSLSHVDKLLKRSLVSGLACASALHYHSITIEQFMTRN